MPILLTKEQKEKKLEEARARNKKRRSRLNSKRVRAAIKAKKPKGKWRGDDPYTLDRCMKEYAKEFDDIIDMTIRTLRRQTKLEHPKKDLVTLSSRLIYLYGTRGPIYLDRDDLEQDLKLIWARCYRKCREMGWGLKTNFLHYAAWFLPYDIGKYVSRMRHDKPDEVSYTMEETSDFDINLPWVMNGSDEWPASLFNARERYIIFLLQEYPGEYTRIARMTRLDLRGLWDIVRDLKRRFTEELQCQHAHNRISSTKNSLLVQE
jgi:hypothetical protein